MWIVLSAKCLEVVDGWLSMAQIQLGPILHAVNQYGHVSDRPLNPRSLTEIYRNLAQRAGLPDYLVQA